MTLRRKTILILLLTVLALIGAIYFVLTQTFLKSFADLENSRARENVERVRNAFADDLQQMATMNADWGEWTDTLEFMRGQKPDYVPTNLTESTLARARLSGMIYLDTTSVVRQTLQYTTAPDAKPLPPSLLSAVTVPANHLLLHEKAGLPPYPDNHAPSARGLLNLGSDGIYMVTGNGITDADVTQPVAGTLLFLRQLDQPVLERLSELTKFHLASSVIGNGTMPPDFQNALDNLSGLSPTHLSPVNDSLMAGYFLVNDLQGRPALIIRLDMDRDIHLKGQETLRVLLVSLAAASAAFLLVSLLLLDRTVTSRLYRLSHQASHIGQTRDFTGRVETRGSDEVAQLGSSVNTMLSALEQAEAGLERRNRQMDQILGSVSEGLFLIDRQFRIADEHSRALSRLFGPGPLASEPLPAVLRRLLEPKTCEQAEDYLDILFDPNLIPDLITGINPLRQTEATVPRPDGSTENRHLAFSFQRITDSKGAIPQVLVSVEDITRRILLAKELEQQERKSQDQLDLVLQLIRVEPRSLAEFLDNLDSALAHARTLIHSPTDQAPPRAQRLATLFRSAHSLKGEAGLLRLPLYEKRLHTYEDRLQSLLALPETTPPDLNTLSPHLANLAHLAEDARSAVENFRRLQIDSLPALSSETSFLDSLAALVRNLAHKLAKPAQLYCHLRDDDIPTKYRQLFRDAFIQIIRNSMTHGIEPPETRSALGKPPIGILQLALNRHPASHQIEFVFQDDGSGLDLPRIQAKAAELGLPATTDDQLKDLIFEPGFSTAETVTLESGRGVGLDIIRHRVTELGGRIFVHTQPGQYCAFQILLPE